MPSFRNDLLKAQRRKHSFLLLAFRTHIAKLEPHGVMSNASVRFLWIVKLSYVSPRFPTEEKQLGTKTLLEELFVVF